MGSELLEFVLVRGDDSDAVVLEGVSVDEDGVDSGDLRVDLFDLLRSDVLSLCQLEDVLGSVDDLEGSVGQQLTDVSTVHESVLVDALVSLGLVLVVSETYGMTSDADLVMSLEVI